MHRKLKAFTLLELLVSMAITAMVVSIASLAYHMQAKQFRIFKQSNNELASVFLLNYRLEGDLLEAADAKRLESTIILTKQTKSPVRYEFRAGNIIRSEGETADTFFIDVENIQSKFLHEERSEGIVDELYFEAIVGDRREHFHYTKLYGADKLLNEEETQHGY